MHNHFTHRAGSPEPPWNPADQIVAHAPGFSNSAVNLSTAAAIRNLSESELVVTCRLMQEGAVLEEVEIHLEANGQEAQFIEEMFTFISANMLDFVGSVRCTAPPGEGMFTGVAMEIAAGPVQR